MLSTLTDGKIVARMQAPTRVHVVLQHSSYVWSLAHEHGIRTDLHSVQGHELTDPQVGSFIRASNPAKSGQNHFCVHARRLMAPA